MLDGLAARRSVNAPLLAGIIYASHADHAHVEHVAARHRWFELRWEPPAFFSALSAPVGILSADLMGQ
jgi:hypothetical protein